MKMSISVSSFKNLLCTELHWSKTEKSLEFFESELEKVVKNNPKLYAFTKVKNTLTNTYCDMIEFQPIMFGSLLDMMYKAMEEKKRSLETNIRITRSELVQMLMEKYDVQPESMIREIEREIMFPVSSNYRGKCSVIAVGDEFILCADDMGCVNGKIYEAVEKILRDYKSDNFLYGAATHLYSFSDSFSAFQEKMKQSRIYSKHGLSLGVKKANGLSDSRLYIEKLAVQEFFDELRGIASKEETKEQWLSAEELANMFNISAFMASDILQVMSKCSGYEDMVRYEDIKGEAKLFLNPANTAQFKMFIRPQKKPTYQHKANIFAEKDQVSAERRKYIYLPTVRFACDDKYNANIRLLSDIDDGYRINWFQPRTASDDKWKRMSTNGRKQATMNGFISVMLRNSYILQIESAKPESERNEGRIKRAKESLKRVAETFEHEADFMKKCLQIEVMPFMDRFKSDDIPSFGEIQAFFSFNARMTETREAIEKILGDINQGIIR